LVPALAVLHKAERRFRLDSTSAPVIDHHGYGSAGFIGTAGITLLLSCGKNVAKAPF